jgi:hypothetical protein
MSNLKDRLEEFRKTFESGAPPYNVTPDIVATMHRATAELKASGIEGRALKIGDRAPYFRISRYLIRTTSKYRRKICFEKAQWL